MPLSYSIGEPLYIGFAPCAMSRWLAASAGGIAYLVLVHTSAPNEKGLCCKVQLFPK